MFKKKKKTTEGIQWFEERKLTFLSAKHGDNHLHIHDLTDLHNSPSLWGKDLNPHFAGNETEAAGRTAWAEPAGGAPPGVWLACECSSPRQRPLKSYTEDQRKKIQFQLTVSSRSGNNLCLLSFTCISIITSRSKQRGKTRGISKGSFLFRIALDSCSFLSTAIQPPVPSVLENISRTSHLYPIPLPTPILDSHVPSWRLQPLPKGFPVSYILSCSQLIFQVAARVSIWKPSCRPIPAEWLLVPPDHIIQEPRLHSWDPDSFVTASLSTPDSHFTHYPVPGLCLDTLCTVPALGSAQNECFPSCPAPLPAEFLNFPFLKLQLKCISWIQACAVCSPPPSPAEHGMSFTSRTDHLQRQLQ